MNTCVYITYDGIENSVFAGQVLAPLLQRQAQQPEQKIIVVSFEPDAPSCVRHSLAWTTKTFLRKRRQDAVVETLKYNWTTQGTAQSANIIQNYQNIELKILKRFPFLGTLSLMHSVYLLKKVLRPLKNYELMARGPLAGFIAQHAVTAPCTSLLVQARGLLAEEYAHTHRQHATFLHTLFHWYRAWSLKKIEQAVYGPNKNKIPTTIEAVSPALKEYLMTTYGTQEHRITVAHRDIPQPITQAQKARWRQEIRARLNIPQSAHVYCYNGSVKSWQCPEMTVAFFKEALQKKSDSFLLIITQHKEAFMPLLADIDERNYHLITVAHHDIYRYLAAADSGILFREPALINWVSRPTKLLEYQAVGLEVIHNNTVAYIKSPARAASKNLKNLYFKR